MASNKYYSDELAYLRDLGREFALAHPQAAPFLAEAGADPDVERLLEGFAFLTGRIREKLDDEQAAYNQQLIHLLWPHYLRPVPSATIIQFKATPQAARETRVIPAGVEVASQPVDGTSCRFTTAYDVTLAPVAVAEFEARSQPSPQLRLRLQAAPGTTLADFTADRLRLHLAGERLVTRSLYACLCRYLKRILVRVGTDAPFALADARVEAVGFAPEHALLPYDRDAFAGYRLLQEYFCYPQKFMFVDLVGVGRLQQLSSATSVDLIFELERFPENMPPIGVANIQLQCTPAVNAFAHDADPIPFDRSRTSFKIRPRSSDPRHFETYRVESVTGLAKSGQAAQPFAAMYQFGRRGDEQHAYSTQIEPSVLGDGNDTYLALSLAREDADFEALGVELTCTNRQLPTRLELGDIDRATPASSPLATFRNITRATPSLPPPAGGDRYWRLISHLALNYLSLCRVDTLREILSLYDFAGLADRQLERSHQLLLQAISDVRAEQTTRLYRGAPLRGMAVLITINEDQAGGEGEIALFGAVLNEFFAQYVTLNSFCQVRLTGEKFGEVHEWPPRIGRRSIL